MSNLKEIKRKIKSVHNTQKTTNAMKLVSTAKLKKAEEVAKRSKNYAKKIDEMLSEISFYINKVDYQESDSLSFFYKRDNIKTMDIIFITADKGLCGGFNIKTIKTVNEIIKKAKDDNIKVRLIAVGKTGIEYFKFKNVYLYKTYLGLSSSPDYSKACSVIEEVVNDYKNKITDEIILVHNGYKNMISQEIMRNDLIPIKPKKIEESDSNLEFEPDNDDLLDSLIKTYFEYNMYFSLIDSLAAEHSARMQAMDNATNNAKARVKQLNLAYNKARQESITTELIEIISGVESMK